MMFTRSFLRRQATSTNMMVQQPRRFFDLHEFHSKKLMATYGINVQKGQLASNAEEAASIASTLSNKGGLIVKAQVQAGGRGKGHLTSGMKGGVHILKTPEEVAEKTKNMIGYNLITHQTPPEGLPVKSVLVHEGVDIDKQIYLAFLHDRKDQGLCCVYSQKGGMDIEEVAASDPDAIHVHKININDGFHPEDAAKIADNLALEGKTRKQGIEQLQKLYGMFNSVDATQIEVNPWAITPEKDIYCVDAKINIDENAGFRQKEIIEQHGNSESSSDTDANEEKATNAGLNYIALDGNIGCMVNGAGLAMATMDTIQLKGGMPANFLDVGGSANLDQIVTAFEILTGHQKVSAIFVNIFGGIMRCDVIAQGIIGAAQKVKVDVPIVVRLAGSNADIAFDLLTDFSQKNSDVDIEVINDFDKAALKVVEKAL